MDDEDDDVPQCPLCLEELDATDRAVEACQCGYQVCLWCLHHIREQLNSRCPACRTPYQEQNFKYAEVNPEEAAKEAKERATAKKERERREKIKEIEKERARAVAVSQQKAKNNLKHARIIQKNLVYVIGLSLTLAREEVIRRADMFGKFGRMLRILVNRSHPFNANAPGGPSISAYVQYVRDSDASAAVRAMNNAVFDGREIRCAIATTKYCDAFVRSTTATAALYCGNASCMYYHAISQEPTLSREEVLARQLGPPPPAHLFLPPDNRRLNPLSSPLHHRIPPHSASAAPSPPNRSLPIRLTTNPVPGVQPAQPGVPSASLPSIHPPTVPLPISSQPTINPPIHTSVHLTAGSNAASSPLSSPRRHTHTHMVRKPPVNPSAHRTPPSSPPDNCRPLPRVHRSPVAREAGPSHVAPIAPTPSAASSSAPISSSVPIPPFSGLRGRGQIRRARENAPPGFEDASPMSPSVVLSRPPGFGAPTSRSAPNDSRPNAGSSASTGQKGSNSGTRQRSRSPSAPVSQPPGFGPGPISKKEIAQKSTNDVAAAWSQEASSDEVFSSNVKRFKGGPVGQLGLRSSVVAQDDADARSELAQVLAKLGGDLGVSSEFQNVQTSPSFAPGTNRESRVSGPRPFLRSTGPLHTPKVEDVKSAPLESLFGNQPIQTGYADRGALQSSNGLQMRDRGRPSGMAQGDNSSFDNPFLRGSASAPKKDVSRAPPSRRNNSRFGFAREDPSELTGITHSQRRFTSFPQEGQNLKRANVSELPFQTNGVSKRESSLMNELNELTSIAKPPVPSPARQPRSRFDFADRGSSPPRVQEMPCSSRANRIPAPQQAHSNPPFDKDHVNDAFSASFAQLSTQEKLESLFNSVQWSAEPLPPMPAFEPQVDHLSLHANMSVVTSQPSSSTDAGSLCHTVGTKTTSSADNPSSSSADNVRTSRTTRSRRIQFAPPGFREATPGISPETTAVDTSSASTGVATNVGSGGVQAATSGVDNSRTNSNVDESLSSGTESFEEDRRRSRAQRKRDKKARQLKEAAERKSSDVHGAPTEVVGQVSETVPSSATGQPILQSKPAEVVQAVRTPRPIQPVQLVSQNVEVQKRTADQDQEIQQPNVQSFSLREMKNVPRGQIPNTKQKEAALAVLSGKVPDDPGKYMSVSELEREVEAARAREAQLQDRLLELQRRIRSYDNVRT